MLKLERIIKDPEGTIRRLNRRGGDFSYVGRLVELDRKRQRLSQERETLKKMWTEVDKKVGYRLQAGRSLARFEERKDDAKEQLKTFEQQIKVIEAAMRKMLLLTPNIVHDSVPDGKANRELKRVDPLIETIAFPKPYREFKEQVLAIRKNLSEQMQVYFTAMGYQEILISTGVKDALFGRYKGETFLKESLPVYDLAVKHGQPIDKLALSMVADHDTSYAEYENMLSHITQFLDALGIPYRVFDIAAGNLQRFASKACRIDLVLPISDTTKNLMMLFHADDYVAHRLNMRIDQPMKRSLSHVHTVFSSMVSLDLLSACYVETHQDEHGQIRPFSNPPRTID